MATQSETSQQFPPQSENRNAAPLRSGDDLSGHLESLGSRREESGGSVLFRQGQAATGIYLIRSGRVDLSLAAARRKRLVGQTVGPGAILGLPAVVSGEPYSLTAITLEGCEVVFIQREDVLDILRTDPVLAMPLVEALAREVHRLRDLWPRQPRKASRHAKRRG
jgi:CRP-like cAMP-binding protein